MLLQAVKEGAGAVTVLGIVQAFGATVAAVLLARIDRRDRKRDPDCFTEADRNMIQKINDRALQIWTYLTGGN